MNGLRCATLTSEQPDHATGRVFTEISEMRVLCRAWNGREYLLKKAGVKKAGGIALTGPDVRLFTCLASVAPVAVSQCGISAVLQHCHL